MIIILTLGMILSQNLYAEVNLNQLKKNCRREVIEKAQFIQDKSMILRGDNAEDLVENPSLMIFDLEKMESLNLTNKALTKKPWSDSYWPLFEGALGNRYNDPDMNFSNWKEAKKYINSNPAKNLIKNKKLDILSPSEKYDLLLGLEGATLTKSSWAEGEAYYKQNGTVETWMGLCHGWSAAAMMMPNPEKKVEVKTNVGNLTFFPSDIKGLATLLWAKGEFQSRFIGGRCNTKGPKTDENNRPLEANCLDNNPGTWHLAIVNQIGVFDRSFVMDATYDYQVWNQPVYSYEYTYYNPKTLEDKKSLSEAIVKTKTWSDDKRKNVRSPKTDSIVGIKMRVTYVSENSPSSDEFQESNLTSIELKYDLELDTENKIIGGEWYSKNHPDFLWVADKFSFPKTFGDNTNEKINLDNISSVLRDAAAVNARSELPFGPIVRELFKASAQ